MLCVLLGMADTGGSELFVPIAECYLGDSQALLSSYLGVKGHSGQSLQLYSIKNYDFMALCWDRDSAHF